MDPKQKHKLKSFSNERLANESLGGKKETELRSIKDYK